MKKLLSSLSLASLLFACTNGQSQSDHHAYYAEVKGGNSVWEAMGTVVGNKQYQSSGDFVTSRRFDGQCAKAKVIVRANEICYQYGSKKGDFLSDTLWCYQMVKTTDGYIATSNSNNTDTKFRVQVTEKKPLDCK